MTTYLLLFDVPRFDPASQSVGWVTIAVFMGIVLVLAVSFCAALVFFLIRLKRRSQKVEAYAELAGSNMSRGEQS